MGDISGHVEFAYEKMYSSLNTIKDANHEALIVQERRRKIMWDELELAGVIQRGLMPEKIETDLFTAGIYYRPLEKVSGDYYDCFSYPDGSRSLVIGDVSGHGVPAALITVMARVEFEQHCRPQILPGKILEEINANLARLVVTSDYMTAFLILIGPDGNMKYSNASHQMVIVLRTSGEVIELDTDGFFLGALEESPIPFVTNSMKLEKGDRIIFYTDGVVEATNESREEFGSKRFINSLKEAANSDVNNAVEKVISDWKDFTGEEPLRDDVTLLIIEFTGAIKSQSVKIEEFLEIESDFAAKNYKQCAQACLHLADSGRVNVRQLLMGITSAGKIGNNELAEKLILKGSELFSENSDLKMQKAIFLFNRGKTKEASVIIQEMHRAGIRSDRLSRLADLTGALK